MSDQRAFQESVARQLLSDTLREAAKIAAEAGTPELERGLGDLAAKAADASPEEISVLSAEVSRIMQELRAHVRRRP